MPNFADAPGDLSIDGRNWTTAKDYAELHEVTRVMTDHIIQRYGEASLTFVWSVFNEPDLGVLFWRCDWNELQRFYDYTTDAVLRAFEDRGYDSRKVFIGGLELGGIFGTHLKLNEFLTHCSPRAQGKTHCRITPPSLTQGWRANVRGAWRHFAAPITAKVRPAISSPSTATTAPRSRPPSWPRPRRSRFKSTPNTMLACGSTLTRPVRIGLRRRTPPPPTATWATAITLPGAPTSLPASCARRPPTRATPMVRPSSPSGHSPIAISRASRTAPGPSTWTTTAMAEPTVRSSWPRPSFTSSICSPPWAIVLAHFEQVHGGHVIAGFASRTDGDLRVLLYTHNALDTQSRSEQAFNVALDLAGVSWPRVQVREYRFDRDHHTYYRLGQQLRDGRSREVAATNAIRPRRLPRSRNCRP